MKNENDPIVILLAILMVVGLLASFAAVGALIITWAWNAFMPSVFGLREITFLQAFALTLLIGTLRGLFSVQIQKKG